MGKKLVHTVGYRLERILKLLENDLKQFYLTEQTLNVFNTVFMFDRKFVGWSWKFLDQKKLSCYIWMDWNEMEVYVGIFSTFYHLRDSATKFVSN